MTDLELMKLRLRRDLDFTVVCPNCFHLKNTDLKVCNSCENSDFVEIKFAEIETLRRAICHKRGKTFANVNPKSICEVVKTKGSFCLYLDGRFLYEVFDDYTARSLADNIGVLKMTGATLIMISSSLAGIRRIYSATDMSGFEHKL
jgi:hypothetical protein